MKQKILVVDDEDDITSTVTEVLRAQKIYEVDSTCDSAEAFKLAKTNQYDLLISDFNLPMLNGDSLFMHIRKDTDNSKRKSPKLLLMSGMLDRKTLKSRLDSVGGNSLLRKPFSSEALLLEVETTLMIQT